MTITIENFEKYLNSQNDFEILMNFMWHNHKNDGALFKFEFNSDKLDMLRPFARITKSLIRHLNTRDPMYDFLERIIVVIHDDISRFYNDDNLKQRCHRCLQKDELSLYKSSYCKNRTIYFERISNMLFNNIPHSKIRCYVVLHLYDVRLHYKCIDLGRLLLPLDKQSYMLPKFVNSFNDRWYAYYKKEKEKAEENKKFCHRFYDDILYSLPEEYSEYSSETSWSNEEYSWVFDPQ